jgi:hypothetical protein
LIALTAGKHSTPSPGIEGVHVLDTTSALFKRSGEVIGAELEDGIVLLQMQNWTYLELNETGIEIWRLLELPQTVSALVTSLTEQFEIDEPTCSLQTQTFVDELKARQFICLAE